MLLELELMLGHRGLLLELLQLELFVGNLLLLGLQGGDLLLETIVLNLGGAEVGLERGSSILLHLLVLILLMLHLSLRLHEVVGHKRLRLL